MADFPRTYDPRQVEERISAFWKSKGIINAALADGSKPLFSFLEGPPTANAPPALHHVEMRTIKDLVCRYKLMKGFAVPRKAGWDCHGLPVEVQVEKKIGLKSKRDVLDFGIGKFNELCRTDVFSYISEWNKLTEKMAFWIDLDKPYVTLSNDYIESVWWSLKQLYDKKLLYEDFKVLPYCPRCETPLSSHEVALGYQDVSEPSATVAFQLKDRPSRYLLAWTTTPWTVPGNIALAVHPGIEYAVVESSRYPGKQFVLAKALVEKFFDSFIIVETFLGESLSGAQYVPAFDYFVGKFESPAWFVTLADFVSIDEGTGIVHQAPAFGEEDYNNCKKHGLPFVQPVGEDGKFTAVVEDFAGLFVKDADALIISELEKNGLLFRKDMYTHSYPFCWRCQSPLLYYALRSWFIAVSRFKDRLIELNGQVNWFPSHIKEGRFGDWLSNVKDWALSRNKFWGTPLPIWKCGSCSSETVIGSVKELRDKGISVPKDLDLHKPFIDEIKLRCSCGSEMSRVPYVIDCWYDSGAASFAQFHYPFAKGSQEAFEKSFPYDFIAEAIDQTRGWFYTLHVLGTLLFDSVAYRNVVCAGHVVDENGEKMSKSRGNVLNPWDMFEKSGVDAVRLQFLTTSPEAPKRFSESLISENITPFLTVLWNSCYYAWEVLQKPGTDSALRVEDKWMISRVNSAVKAVEASIEQNEYHICLQHLKAIVADDFSRWYIRIVRNRSVDDALQYTMKYVLARIVKMLAPFAPYISEEVYQIVIKEKAQSVHLSQWPVAEAIDIQLESQMDLARSIVESVLAARDKMQRGLRWPLKRVFIITKDESVKASVRALADIIKKQANIKELALSDQFREARMRVKADYGRLGPVFGSLTPKIIAQLAMHGSSAILSHVEQDGAFRLEVDGQMVSVTKDHLITEVEIPSNYTVEKAPLFEVYADSEMTAEMEAEGYVRELARHIQQARKDAGLKKEEKVAVVVVIPDSLEVLKDSLEGFDLEKIGASSFGVSSRPGKFDFESVARIKGENVEIFLTKN